MSLTTLTKQILDERVARQKQFAVELDNLNNYQSDIELILTLNDPKKTPLWGSIVADCRPTWNTIVTKAESLHQRIALFKGEDGIFTLAKARADRAYVNIGIIGMVGDGKSVFIAKVTKLSDGSSRWILPRRATSTKVEKPWTSASINVISGNSLDGKKNIARVYFYTVKELASTLKTYLSELNLNDDKSLGRVTTRDELKRWCNQNIGWIMRSGNTQGILYRKFLNYIQNIDQYLEYLIEDSKVDPLFIDYSIDDIVKGGAIGKEYYSSVSYYDNPDAVEGSETYKSFATRKADIFTTFKIGNEIVTNIQFLDTPGIGEQKVGVNEALADAISMKLDIIIALRAITGHNKESAEQVFINILRQKLAGKEHASEWIHYLLNVWDGITYNHAINRRNDIKDLLSQGDPSTAIILPDTNFGIINIVNDYELKKGDLTDSNEPIERYLFNIISSVIPSIPEIDGDFFGDSDKEYSEIVKEYNALKALMLSLDVPSFSNDENIQKLLQSLSNALATPGKTPNIMSALNHRINDFCEQMRGTLTAKTVGEDKLAVDSDDVSGIASAIRPKLELFYQEADYEAGRDFMSYTSLKLKLRDTIAADIKKRVDPTKADESLKVVKEKIAKIFIDAGRMGFISNDPSKWYEQFKEQFGRKKEYSHLFEILKTFFEWEIDVQRMIEPKIKSVTRNCLHHDHFVDDKEEDTFDTYDNALECVVRSLLNIEGYAQGLINDGMIIKDIEDRQKEFETVYYNATRLLTHQDAVSVTDVRKELELFYKKNAAKVFVDDELMQKQGLVSQWEEMLK